MSKRCIPCDLQRIRKQFEEKRARKAAETQEKSQNLSMTNESEIKKPKRTRKKVQPYIEE